MKQYQKPSRYQNLGMESICSSGCLDMEESAYDCRLLWPRIQMPTSVRLEQALVLVLTLLGMESRTWGFADSVFAPPYTILAIQ